MISRTRALPWTDPWAEVMSCSTENVDGAQRALREILVDRATDKKHRPRLLYLALLGVDRAISPAVVDEPAQQRRWYRWAADKRGGLSKCPRG